jgi:hypothetical protein
MNDPDPPCECGEPAVSRCRAAFDAALAAEFGDPEYFAVHHLTVAAYQVQHPRTYPLRGAFEVLRRFVDEGVAPSQMRRDLTAGDVGSDVRADGAAVTGALRLSSVRLDDAVAYCDDVERYARSVLEAATRTRRTRESGR